MNIDKLDQLDDKIFDVVCEIAYELNSVLSLGHDISQYNHTELVINVRESIAEELKRQEKEHE